MNHPIGELLLQSGEEILKMWNVTVEPFQRPFVKHAHTRFEITVVNKGCGEYTTLDRVYPIEPGDVFVFSSNEVHCITKTGTEGLHITNLHFEPRYLDGKRSEIVSGSYLSFCFSHGENFSNRIPAAAAARIREHHHMIREELQDTQKEYPVAIKAHLNLILIELLRRHRYESAAADAQRAHLASILRVRDYIDTHLSEPLTLHTLAEVANLSPNYFSRVFRQLSGVSLWDYVTAKRIEEASRLICNAGTGMTVLEIALQCGFNNTANFNKAFRKCNGFTPSQLRKDPSLISK